MSHDMSCTPVATLVWFPDPLTRDAHRGMPCALFGVATISMCGDFSRRCIYAI